MSIEIVLYERYHFIPRVWNHYCLLTFQCESIDYLTVKYTMHSPQKAYNFRIWCRFRGVRVNLFHFPLCTTIYRNIEIQYRWIHENENGIASFWIARKRSFWFWAILWTNTAMRKYHFSFHEVAVGAWRDRRSCNEKPCW